MSRRARRRKGNSPMRICSVDGCGRKYVARGFCYRHYGAVVRNGKDPATLSITDRPGVGVEDKELSEHEFVLVKEFRIAGRKTDEVARELDLPIATVKKAWEYRTFADYRSGEKWGVMDWRGTLPALKKITV